MSSAPRSRDAVSRSSFAAASSPRPTWPVPSLTMEAPITVAVDIPLLGDLFRFDSVQESRTELLIQEIKSRVLEQIPD